MTYDENYFINIERYAPFSYLHPITEKSDICKKGVINLIKIKEKKYATRRANWIIDNVNPKSSLDVGTADGSLVKKLLEKGVDSYGVDVSEYQINKLKRVHPNRFFLGEAEKLPFKDGEFEIVTAFHVLEHVIPDQVINSIKEIGRVSKKYIVIEHPAKENFHVNVDNSHVSVHPSRKWKKIITDSLGKKWAVKTIKNATIYKPFFIFLEKN